MLKIVEIRQTFGEYQMHAETLARFSADDVRVQISGDEVVIFIDGNVTSAPANQEQGGNL